jgi:hypothetical protein
MDRRPAPSRRSDRRPLALRAVVQMAAETGAGAATAVMEEARWSRRRLTMKNSPKIQSSVFERIIGATICPNGSKTALAGVKRELRNFARAGEGSSKVPRVVRRNRRGSRRCAVGGNSKHEIRINSKEKNT